MVFGTGGDPDGDELERAVTTVLTAAEHQADAAVGDGVLLLLAAGDTAAAERLRTAWERITQRPPTALWPTGGARRAAAALLGDTTGRPDTDDTSAADDPDAPARVFAAVLAELTGEQLPSDDALPRLRERAAALADAPGGIGRVADALIAALHQRHPAPRDFSWSDLIAAVLDARATGDLERAAAPPPATPSAIAAAERRLGRTLPDDYRDFLSTCDGLPADVVFPRLLGAAELQQATDGPVVISERNEYLVVVLTPPATARDRWLVVEVDPVLGSTTHSDVYGLLLAHLRLLEQ